MSLTIHRDLEQGTDEWLRARCGVLTASTIGRLITPTGKVANNDTSRRLVLDLMAQRTSGIVEPMHQTFDMMRGHDDEIEAKVKYANEIAPVEEVGFMTDDRWGFTIGYSPDGLVGSDGLIECKSRKHALQMQTICGQEVPGEYMAQIQCGLLVSGRQWVDFISYPAMGGGKMMVMRCYPDARMQEALIEAARNLEDQIAEFEKQYRSAISNPALRFFDTERREELELVV